MKKYYTEKEYNLVMKLYKEGLSSSEIIKFVKKKYGIILNRGIEHWMYGGVRPWDVKKPLKGGYEKLTPEKAYILGVLCGDGCITFDHPRVILSSVSKELINEFIACVKSHYGLKPSIRIVPKEKIKISRVENPPHIIKAKRDQINVAFSGRNLVDDLRKYGDFKTNTWRIPKQIINSKNKKIIYYFLRGLYDSEGSAKYHVTLSSNSLDGLKDVQVLLLKLGIQSTIYKSRTCFVLSIHNQRTKQLFKKYIGFRVVSRQKQLESSLANYKTSKSYSQKYVNTLIHEILGLRKSGFSSREIAKQLGIGKSTVLRKLHKYSCTQNAGTKSLIRREFLALL